MKPTLAQTLAAASIALAAAQPANAVQDSNFRFDTTTDLYNVCSVTQTAAE